MPLSAPCVCADTTLDASGKALVNLSLSELAKGVKLSASAALPDPASAKLTVDYTACREFNIRATTTLTSAPVVDLVAVTEYKGVLLGGEAAYDTAKAAVTKYNVAAGYNTAEYQVRAIVMATSSLLPITIQGWARCAQPDHMVPSVPCALRPVLRLQRSSATRATRSSCHTRTASTPARPSALRLPASWRQGTPALRWAMPGSWPVGRWPR